VYGLLFSHKEEQNYVILRKMDGNGDHHVKKSKPDSERQILPVFSYMQTLDFKRKGTSGKGGEEREGIRR
jgi:hypothetical protein